MENNNEKNYDEKGNATHYNATRLNSIIKFERTYGTRAVMHFCEISADKYRERIGKKPGQTLEQELLKINWYEKAARHYFNKMGTIEEITVDVEINPLSRQGLPWDDKK